MATRDRDSWLDDFSFVIDADSVRTRRAHHDFEAFTGSKARALPPLIISAAVAGALGGTAVSAALWSQWSQLPLWLAAFIALVVLAMRGTVAIAGRLIAHLAGWTLFFGLLTGAFAMWAAQLTSTAWAYGIAGGAVFFLLGITGGLIDPPNSKTMESWFLTSAISAPASASLATWIHRNAIGDPGSLEAAALTGAIAALPFLTITMALYLLAWRPERGLKRLAKLYLHNDKFTGEAVELLDRAIRETPDDAELLCLRGLGHGLAGDQASAEADWAQHAKLEPRSNAAAINRGWLELRQNDPATAAQAFAQATKGKKPDPWALIGLGIARLRQGDAAQALVALRAVPEGEADALSLTYLAEAYLRSDNPTSALGVATDAIEELDSTHGRSWLVRAQAAQALGDVNAAGNDYNRAYYAADEPWVCDAAVEGLDAIGRPLSDDEPDW